MTTLDRVLIVACALGLTIPSTAEARDRDKDKKKNDKQENTASRTSGGIEPGTCEPGVAERVLDANNVEARLFNNGSLFFGNSVEAAYVVEGTASIYASGIWVGGKVDGEIVTAGSTYRDFEFWPGPLGADARPVDPNDCSAFDRMWKVTRADIVSYEAGNEAARDLLEWPFELGAPVIDGDGNPENYDLAAGDRPDIVLDQSVWWIMNDVGNTHNNTDSDPLGIEVQGQAFAVGESGPLGNTTFYRYTITNKSIRSITEAYLSVFSDPDLGNEYLDDYVGSDLDLSMGYVYNFDNNDEGGYGVNVPAVGYDFFQGPVIYDDDGVATDTLGLTGFNYFINGGPAELTDPSDRISYYNVMQGLTPPGAPLTESGLGIGGSAAETRFAFSGDPVAGTGWNEVTEQNEPGDRRFVVSTGPFELTPNTPQEIVFGIVWSRATGGSVDRPNIASLAQLRVDDIVAQDAYDNDFNIKRAPPAPPVCQAGADQEFLLPNSGKCLSAVEEDGQVVLTWGYPEQSSNFNAFVR